MYGRIFLTWSSESDLRTDLQHVQVEKRFVILDHAWHGDRCMLGRLLKHIERRLDCISLRTKQLEAVWMYPLESLTNISDDLQRRIKETRQ